MFKAQSMAHMHIKPKLIKRPNNKGHAKRDPIGLHSRWPKPTWASHTHLPPCTNSSCMQSTMSTWRKCKHFTLNSATTTQPPPPTPPHNLTHALIPAHANPANLASPYTPPYRNPFPHTRRSPPSRSNPFTTQDNHTPQRRHDQILSLPPQPWPHYRRMQSTPG